MDYVSSSSGSGGGTEPGDMILHSSIDYLKYYAVALIQKKHT